MTTYIAYNIFDQFIDLAHKDNTEERTRFYLPQGYNFRSLNRKLRFCYKHKYGKKLPKEVKKDYTFKDFVDFSLFYAVRWRFTPSRYPRLLDTYNNCSVAIQVEIIFSIVDMVHRFHCGFDVVQDDEKAQ